MSKVAFTCGIAFAGEVTLAYAATVDLSSVDGNQVAISGTNAISSFGSGANLFRIVHYLAATPLVNSSALRLSPGQNRTTTAGDICVYVSDASGNWTEIAATSHAASAASSCQSYGSSQTITIPAATAKVRMWGGTGGSGGVNAGASGGTGAPGYLEKLLTGLTPGNTLVFTQGNAGAAGTSTPGNGGNGTASTLASGTQTISTLTANGSNGTAAVSSSFGFGTAGGTSTGGDYNAPTMPGTNASPDMTTPGVAGSGPFGFGAPGVANAGIHAGIAGQPGGLIIDWST